MAWIMAHCVNKDTPFQESSQMKVLREENYLTFVFTFLLICWKHVNDIQWPGKFNNSKSRGDLDS